MSKRNTFQKRNQFNQGKSKYFLPKQNKIVERIIEEKQAERFIENVQGLKVSQKKVKHMEQVIKQINKQNIAKYKAIKDKPLISYGKQTDMTVGQRIAMEGTHMGSSLYSQKYGYLKNELMAKFHSLQTKEEFIRYIAWLDERVSPQHIKRKQKKYKRNYIKSIQKQFGDTEDTRAIIAKLKKMSPSKIEMTYLQNEQAFIGYNYTQESVSEKLETLKNIWL